MNRNAKVISIEKIDIDKKFYPRFQTDKQRVREFVQAMEYGEFFEPIKVVYDKKTGRYILLDGRHRIEARIIRGETKIEVYILDIPEEHVLLNAARLNDKSPKPLTPDEIKHVIISAWRNGVKDTDDIAKELGRSQRWIEMILKPVRDEERKKQKYKILGF
ncbi:MAG: ParB/RepB/Spo0J family partition protein [Desulfobacterales bacterium]